MHTHTDSHAVVAPVRNSTDTRPVPRPEETSVLARNGKHVVILGGNAPLSENFRPSVATTASEPR